MIPAPRQASFSEMPVLDLSGWLAGGPADPLVKDLHAACTGTGFFYVTGHGVPVSAVEGVFDATRRYFAEPEALRLDDKIDDRFRRGFMPYGINQHPGYEPDLKESYEFALDLPLDDPEVIARRPLHGPNRWPAWAPWLEQASMRYFEHTTQLGKNLLRLFALALEQDESFFLQWCNKPMVQSRLFHYPPQVVDTDRALGVAPHTDYGMLTILAQDPIGGLELRKRDGEWVSAPYIENTFVVNLGDMFKVWTNDLFVSNFHRVVNRTGKERYSIPTFFNLDYDAPVACLPSCQADDNPPRYEPVKAGDYLVRRFGEVQKFKVM
ncbi:isopenicillin N synthase family dioxygenase [Pararobbsia alpina]|uniref:2-oxoglutarate-dependent ethylene/succinate-forming enzyme n=1 Tax=Pararobbsia alpina TaxID=621374 RepID=A0A6S7CZK8_9BURK|nr:2OG-Fe(II) oxygenase family protein [Pararobbsia alpina]CAB3792208.1 Validamycin A dioxygenase [Pararobbsia alpina]